MEQTSFPVEYDFKQIILRSARSTNDWIKFGVSAIYPDFLKPTNNRFEMERI
jgi:hypothetical protein